MPTNLFEVPFTVEAFQAGMNWDWDFTSYAAWQILEAVNVPLSRGGPGTAAIADWKHEVETTVMAFYQNTSLLTLSWRKLALYFDGRGFAVVLTKTFEGRPFPAWELTLADVDDLPAVAKEEGARTLEEWWALLELPTTIAIPEIRDCRNLVMTELSGVLGNETGMRRLQFFSLDVPGGRDLYRLSFPGYVSDVARNIYAVLERFDSGANQQLLFPAWEKSEAAALMRDTESPRREIQQAYFDLALRLLPLFFQKMNLKNEPFFDRAESAITQCERRFGGRGGSPVPPQRIGITPQSDEWTAYTASEAETLTRRLVALWNAVLLNHSRPLPDNERHRWSIEVVDTFSGNQNAAGELARYHFEMDADNVSTAMMRAMFQARDRHGFHAPIVFRVQQRY